MDYPSNNTESCKNKHLNFKECVISEIRIKDKFTTYKIAKQLERLINTVINEISCGTTTQIIQVRHVEIYLADTAK